MLEVLLLCTALCVAPVPPGSISSQEERAEKVRSRFAELFVERDGEGLRRLWSEHPRLVLPTIDGDLEGSLALWEAAPEEPDLQKIRSMHERALWGARIAVEVTGQPILADYAASFIGWDSDQKKAFRAGQAAHSRSRKALEGGQLEEALAAARECRRLAAPLGDWWGVAMGLAAEGRCLARMGDDEAAVGALGQARLYYSQLGLQESEYGVLMDLCESLVKLERWPRALECADAGLLYAMTLRDREGMAAIRVRRTMIQERLAEDS